MHRGHRARHASDPAARGSPHRLRLLSSSVTSAPRPGWRARHRKKTKAPIAGNAQLRSLCGVRSTALGLCKLDHRGVRPLRKVCSKLSSSPVKVDLPSLLRLGHGIKPPQDSERPWRRSEISTACVFCLPWRPSCPQISRAGRPGAPRNCSETPPLSLAVKTDFAE